MNEKKDSYIVIQRFMTRELNLQGNELIIYAIIHGFSQDGTSFFYGSLDYLEEETNLSRQSIISILDRLIQKGLIVKEIRREIQVFDIKKKLTGNAHFCLYFSKISRENQSPTCEDKEEMKEKPSPVKKLDPTPVKKLDPTPVKKLDPTPVKKLDPTPVKKLDPTPVKKLDPIIYLDNKLDNLSFSDHKDSINRQEERQTEILSCIKNLFGSTKMFSGDLFQKLEHICKKHEMDSISEYLIWTYEAVKKKYEKTRISNFPAYFYRTVLSGENISMYEFSKNEINKTKKTEKTTAALTKCSACHTLHSVYEDCPVCGLEQDKRGVESEVEFRKRLMTLEPGLRSRLEREIISMRKRFGFLCPPGKIEEESLKIYRKYGVKD